MTGNVETGPRADLPRPEVFHAAVTARATAGLQVRGPRWPIEWGGSLGADGAILDWMVVLEPKVSTRPRKRRWTWYRDEKTGMHRTWRGVGVIARIRRPDRIGAGGARS